MSDFEKSESFYDRVLGFLDYTYAHGSDSYAMWNPSEAGCSFGIRLVDPIMADDPYIRGRAGFHHLAFNAENREQINDLYEKVLKEIGVTVLDAPVACPEYSPAYYAVYFEDPDGLKLEVAHS